MSSDDVREILGEVEAPESLDILLERAAIAHGFEYWLVDRSDIATAGLVVARDLSRLVAKYKWQRDTFVRDVANDESFEFDDLIDQLDEAWEKR